MEAAGEAVTIFSTKRPKDKTTHGFSEVAAARTRYLADLRLKNIPAWARAALKALRLMSRQDVRELIRVEGESWRKMFALATVGARLRAVCSRESIRHLHVHSCADAGYVAAFSHLSGGPAFSLSLHGDLAVYGRGHSFKFKSAKFLACVTQALCEQVKSQVTQLMSEPELIRMGIEFDEAIQKKADWSPARELRLVTVARLNPMKGHSHAISAVGDLVRRGYNVNYDIVGEGDHRSAVEQCIADAGLIDHVRMIGPIANDQVTRFLTKYDAFVLPSVGLGEAAPVAVMEAMSVGVPVVSSIIGGTPEMIKDGVTGFLFPQGDQVKLAGILARLADDPSLRKSVGDAGRSHAKSNFLTKHSAARLIKCIYSSSSDPELNIVTLN